MSTTKTTRTMEKIILDYNQSGFEYAEAMFNEKNALIKNIKEVAKKELDLIIEVTDSQTLKANIFKAVEEKFKTQNTLNLTGEKLIDLMQINLEPVLQSSRLLSGYDAVDKEAKPTKEMFTISVDNEQEMERYNHSLKVIEVIKETRKLTNDVRNINTYFATFGTVIRFNTENNDLEPLPQFVKRII